MPDQASDWANIGYPIKIHVLSGRVSEAEGIGLKHRAQKIQYGIWKSINNANKNPLRGDLLRHSQTPTQSRDIASETQRSKTVGLASAAQSKKTKPPIVRAHVELYEETHLKPPLLKLIRLGPTLTFADQSLNTQWKIHPFLFTLSVDSMEEESKVLEELRIDWEHTEYKWIKPEEVTEYDTVPKLEKAWRRVWLMQYLDVGLIRLKEDHVSGARELALEGLGILKRFFDEYYWRDYRPDDIWEEILVVGWHIVRNGRPAMGVAIESAIISTLEDIHCAHLSRKISSDPALVDEFALAAKIIIDSHIQQESNTLNTLCDRFAEYFMNEGFKSLDRKINPVDDDEPCHRLHILTLSNSSTLFHCLYRILTDTDLPVTVRLTILESRPLCEGASLAIKLLRNLPKSSRLGKLEIVPDASIAFHIPFATHVLLGADKIYRNGNLWNKTGSLAAALLANRFDVPLLVVSQTSKVTIEDVHEGIVGEENDSEEMSTAWGEEVQKVLEENRERVHVANGYFKLVLSNLIDGYITEKGVVSAGYMKEVGEKRKDLEQLLFGWL